MRRSLLLEKSVLYVSLPIIQKNSVVKVDM